METKGSLDDCARNIISTDDAIEALLSGSNMSTVIIDDECEFEIHNKHCQRLGIELLEAHTDEHPLEYLERCADTWLIPDEYKTFDIEEYVLSLCNNEKELERVKKELTLFSKYGMICILRLLKYIVDKFEQHHVLWGVGRGSSVASYVLYKLKVHRIDSLKYDLDITEFLKPAE